MVHALHNEPPSLLASRPKERVEAVPDFRRYRIWMAALLAWALPIPGHAAQSAPLMGKDPQSAARIFLHRGLPACRVQVHNVQRYGLWASIYADCAGKEADSIVNLFARKNSAGWIVVCGFGDEDVGPQFARRTCKMPRAIAKLFSLPY